jgi:hypothetical protein
MRPSRADAIATWRFGGVPIRNAMLPVEPIPMKGPRMVKKLVGC